MGWPGQPRVVLICEYVYTSVQSSMKRDSSLDIAVDTSLLIFRYAQDLLDLEGIYLMQ